MLKYSDVFVPGGFPLHTYNPRNNHNLEDKINESRENLCKLVTVTGHTKSGKTVLVQKIFPRNESIWIDGGSVSNENDLWENIVSSLELFQTTEIENKKGSGSELSTIAKGGANLLLFKGEAQIGGKLNTSNESKTAKKQTISSKIAALNGIRLKKIPIIIDDFHYIPKDNQGLIIRAMKPLIFEGIPIIIIAIPHRRYDVLKVEREMTGRISQVMIPTWSKDELKYIPEEGFSKLNYLLSSQYVDSFANESMGSPHLMQDFCRTVCKQKAITYQFEEQLPRKIDNVDLDKIFSLVSESIGKPIFDKLMKGPRQRTDRLKRGLKDGTLVDIYGLVLLALAHLKPGLDTLEYATLRSAIKDITEKDIPQLHEISRVLKQMSRIASTDQSSSPVIDFEEEEKLLHITDPFFAFYLKHGKINKDFN